MVLIKAQLAGNTCQSMPFFRKPQAGFTATLKWTPPDSPSPASKAALPSGEGSLGPRTLFSQRKRAYHFSNEDVQFGDHPPKKKPLELTLVGEHSIQRFLQGFFCTPLIPPLSLEGTARLLGDVPLSLPTHQFLSGGGAAPGPAPHTGLC